MLDKIPTPKHYKRSNAELAELLEGTHRQEDDRFAHVAPGDVVVPPQVLHDNPAIAAAISQAIAAYGADPSTRVVGSGRVNPETGLEEFGFFDFIKKIGSNPIAKTLATVGASLLPGGQYIAPIVAGGLTKAAGGTTGQALGSAAGTYFGSKVGQSLFGATPGQVQTAGANALGNTTVNGLSKVTQDAATGVVSDGGRVLNFFGSDATNFGDLIGNTFGQTVAQAPLNNAVGTAISQMFGESLGASFDPPQPKGLDPINMPTIQSQSLPGGTGNSNLPLPANQTVNIGATGSPTPYAPVGVRYLDPVRDRDTGDVRYAVVDNGDDYRNSRRQGFGGGVIFV